MTCGAPRHPSGHTHAKRLFVKDGTMWIDRGGEPRLQPSDEEDNDSDHVPSDDQRVKKLRRISPPSDDGSNSPTDVFHDEDTSSDEGSSKTDDDQQTGVSKRRKREAEGHNIESIRPVKKPKKAGRVEGRISPPSDDGSNSPTDVFHDEDTSSEEGSSETDDDQQTGVSKRRKREAEGHNIEFIRPVKKPKKAGRVEAQEIGRRGMVLRSHKASPVSQIDAASAVNNISHRTRNPDKHCRCSICHRASESGKS
ncbi:hypothetical protein PTI98_009053 [Pleurotus ostreatus]|nr:hypothetical protein PTI98_009053 [Pleurotus ostreatus]KDQ32308.1 hypothetical protein PLEOSDRAFT_154449 [Pleurotus ostreatus PC15]